MDIQHITGRITPDAARPPKPENTGENGRNGQHLSFNEVLQQVQQPGELRFSRHAMKRLENRSISLNNSDMSRIQEAVLKAEKKGSRESLVLDGDHAFVINIKSKTVITALDMMEMRERVFTNIDSTVVTNQFST